MSARILTLGAAFLLGACSTVQENPNYQYSSKYGGAETSPNVQLANQTAPEPAYAQARIEPVAQNRSTISANHSGDQSTSPTEQAYDADAMAGTPGYAIFLAEQAEAQAAAPSSKPTQESAPKAVPVGTPQPITYDYAQNITVTDQPNLGTGIVAHVNTLTTSTYVVQPGDTVYSLSRRLCAPIVDIMAPNGISANFAIDIGQKLELPASRC